MIRFSYFHINVFVWNCNLRTFLRLIGTKGKKNHYKKRMLSDCIVINYMLNLHKAGYSEEELCAFKTSVLGPFWVLNPRDVNQTFLKLIAKKNY